MSRRGGTGRIVAALVSLAVVLVMGPANAASVDDPNLAHGPLDLRRLTAHKHDATAPMRLTLVTYGSWRPKLLDASGDNRLFFLFNANGTGGVDYIGTVAFRHHRLSMVIRTGGGSFVRKVRVRHPTHNSIKTTVPRGLPNPDGNVWLAAGMQYRGGSDCTHLCHDRIPGKGWMKLTPGL
jgi:hypothetical protein